jgi:hypothetical protein
MSQQRVRQNSCAKALCNVPLHTARQQRQCCFC